MTQPTDAENDAFNSNLLNLRADLMAYRVVLHASFIAMSPAARSALLHNVRYLGNQTIAHGLAHSRSADDTTIHAMQAALDRAILALEQLPAS